MTICNPKYLLLLIAVLSLFACSGDDNEKNAVLDDNIVDTGDTDTTSQQTGIVSMGIVSGFGSAFLNGVQYDTTEVIVTFAGQSIPFEDLDVGDVAVLSKSKSDYGAVTLTEIEVVT